MEELQALESLVNIESEYTVLGTIFDNKIKLNKIENISPNIFSSESNKIIFKVLLDIISNEDKIDVPIFLEKLKKTDVRVSIESINNMLMYSNLYTFESNLKILEELYVKRNTYERAKALMEGIIDGADIDKLIYDFQEGTEANKQVNNDYKDDIKSICEELMDYFEKEDDGSNRYNSGIPTFDRLAGGIFKGELLTIGAKSGVGKTALALNIALEVMKAGGTILIVSREMDKTHIVQRLLTMLTSVKSMAMKTKKLEANDWTKIIEGMSILNAHNIYVNSDISKPSQIRRRVREVKADLLIVDYLQLLSSDEKSSNREREVASLSREMRKITLDFNCAVIQLSQLNDDYKGRPWGEKPMRESKAIYQDSSNVIYIHKPIELTECVQMADGNEKLGEQYKKLNTEDSPVKMVEIIVSKCRDGSTGCETYAYLGEQLRFKELKKQ